MPATSDAKALVKKPDRASRAGAPVNVESGKAATPKKDTTRAKGVKSAEKKPRTKKAHSDGQPSQPKATGSKATKSKPDTDAPKKKSKPTDHATSLDKQVVIEVSPSAGLADSVDDTLEAVSILPRRRGLIVAAVIALVIVVAISVALVSAPGGSEPTVSEPFQECDLNTLESFDKRANFNDEVVCPAGWTKARSTVYDSWPRDYSECVDYVGCEYAGLFHTVYAGQDNNCNAPAKMLSGGNAANPSVKCRFPSSVVGQWSIAATYGRDLELLGRKVKVAVPMRQSQSQNNENNTPSSSQAAAAACFVTINVVDSCGVPEICDPVITEAPVLLDLEAQTACRIFGCDYTDPTFAVSKVTTVPKFLCFRDDGVADPLP